MAGSSRLCIPEIRDALLTTRPQRMAQSIDALRQQWTAAGQGHCLQYVDELDAALGSWPCLRRMLRSPAPEAFAEECTQAEHERHSDLALAPPAKGRGDVLRCEAAAGSATACALVARGGVRLGANA